MTYSISSLSANMSMHPFKETKNGLSVTSVISYAFTTPLYTIVCNLSWFFSSQFISFCKKTSLDISWSIFLTVELSEIISKKCSHSESFYTNLPKFLHEVAQGISPTCLYIFIQNKPIELVLIRLLSQSCPRYRRLLLPLFQNHLKFTVFSLPKALGP